MNFFGRNTPMNPKYIKIARNEPDLVNLATSVLIESWQSENGDSPYKVSLPTLDESEKHYIMKIEAA